MNIDVLKDWSAGIENMKKYRIGIIGRSGRGDYGHGLDEVWRNVPEAELVGIADENPAGLKARADRLGIKARYGDYRKMLASETPDIVSVAPRWPDCHHDMVLACAEHGASVFLEKPMCRTLAEADSMVRACEEKHVKLAIAHQTRYSPRIRRSRSSSRMEESAGCSSSGGEARKITGAEEKISGSWGPISLTLCESLAVKPEAASQR